MPREITADYYIKKAAALLGLENEKKLTIAILEAALQQLSESRQFGERVRAYYDAHMMTYPPKEYEKPRKKEEAPPIPDKMLWRELHDEHDPVEMFTRWGPDVMYQQLYYTPRNILEEYILKHPRMPKGDKISARMSDPVVAKIIVDRMKKWNDEQQQQITAHHEKKQASARDIALKTPLKIIHKVDYEIEPGKPPNVERLLVMYGPEQLPAALARYSHKLLLEAAKLLRERTGAPLPKNQKDADLIQFLITATEKPMTPKKAQSEKITQLIDKHQLLDAEIKQLFARARIPDADDIDDAERAFITSKKYDELLNELKKKIQQLQKIDDDITAAQRARGGLDLNLGAPAANEYRNRLTLLGTQRAKVGKSK